MSDVSNIKTVSLVTPSVARASDAAKKVADGKSLPPVTDAAAAARAAPVELVTEQNQDAGAEEQKQNLQDALGSMNDFVQNVKRDLQFSVDKELNQTVIKVVDSASGKLIRQIPEDIFLELARKVKESGEFNLLNATG